MNAFVNFDYSQYKIILQTLVLCIGKPVIWLNESSIPV